MHPILQGAHVVNVGRGGVLDYDAVMAALESGHLGGLGIDVAWTEPFDPSDPLLKYPNVLITPHIAGVTKLSYQNMSKVCLHINAFLVFHVIFNQRKFYFTSQKDFAVQCTLEEIREAINLFCPTDSTESPSCGLDCSG